MYAHCDWGVQCDHRDGHWDTVAIRPAQPNHCRMRPSRVIVLSLAVGLFFIAQFTAMSLVGGRPITGVDLLQEALYWATWVVLSPLMLVAIERWPLNTGSATRAIAVHLVGSVMLATLQAFAAFSLYWGALRLIDPATTHNLAAWLRQHGPTITWGVFMGAFYYWLVVGVSTAWQYRSRNAALEVELTRAQLETLRSQLRPHFLFNTLNAISVLTVEDPPRARAMLLRLGTLLRRSLDEEQHEVPLAQELMFLNDYLDIQRERFGSRLQVELAIDRSVEGVRVPVLLLQPLVENAIQYGAPELTGQTVICLRADRVNGTLRLRVDDNGPGLGDPDAVREGIGLRNTRERLHRLYGDRATLDLQDVGDTGGTRIEITIPWSTAAA